VNRRLVRLSTKRARAMEVKGDQGSEGTRMSNRNLARSAALVAAVVSLSACGLSDYNAQATVSSMPHQGWIEPLKADADEKPFTKPGISVPAGETIIIPMWYTQRGVDEPPVVDPAMLNGYGTDAVSLEVTGMRVGKIDDLTAEFAQADLDKVVGYDIYYIDYTVREDAEADATLWTNSTYFIPSDANVGTDLVGAPTIDAVDTSGKVVTGNFVFYDGGPEACPMPVMLDLVEVRRTRGCAIALVDKGSKIDHLIYNGFDLLDNYQSRSDPYASKPIIIGVPAIS